MVFRIARLIGAQGGRALRLGAGVVVVCYGVSMVMFLHESISMVQMVGVVLIVGRIIVANQG